MKKIFITAAFFAMSTFAMAQEDQQPSDDQLQQQAPRESQTRNERAATRDAKNEELNAKKAEEVKKEAEKNKNTATPKKEITPSDKKTEAVKPE
jgi:Ni/Co efflux regulator RcnB